MAWNKHVFWQALVVALLVFFMGIFWGVYFEEVRINKIENFYFDSETEIFDLNLASDIVFDENIDCDSAVDNTIFFADRIYAEAKRLEKYDDANKVTEDLILLHRRYDLLRVMLWRQTLKTKESCSGDLNSVVYIYQYQKPSINTRALQGVMSNKLLDLKKEYGDKMVLIPIAGDTGVQSLDIMREIYDVEDYPVILVNEEAQFKSVDDLTGIEEALK
ncbi:hypothetical protein CMI46_02645 [Candidatus Pacearchaeota archaeon]|nr:hypothetical protein [Candidatus Pacearchaeota archaeon]|tara:strand:+ start:190 stop:843 length:654 start_codon:yes stop_codon:yes gene_type:complete